MLSGDEALNLSTKPSVLLVIGVNGVGKTTTIGKLANNLRQDGKKVLLAALIPSVQQQSISFRSGQIVHRSSW